MNKIVALALGANELVIPCLFFDDWDEAIMYCIEALNVEGELRKDGICFRFDFESGNEAASEKFFTSCYYGCGGPYAILLQAVPSGKPFVGWDLD